MSSYKVVGFSEVSGSISVEYDVNFPSINVDIPLDENGLYITGEALDKYIQGFIPTWHLDRLAKLKAGISNASEIQSLVQEPTNTVVVPAQTMTDEEIANQQMWEQVNFERKLGNALVKFGLLETNPIEIPVAAQ